MRNPPKISTCSNEDVNNVPVTAETTFRSADSRSRPTRSARASTRGFMLAWFYNLGATSNPPIRAREAAGGCQKIA